MSMYTKLAEIPVPTGAQFVGQDRIELSFSARDHARDVKKYLLKHIVLSSAGEAAALPTQEVSYVASRYSPSGRTRAVLREVKEWSGSGSKYFVELWAGDRLKYEVDVTEKHGAFYADEYIGTLSFNQDETSLVYTAEALIEKDDNDPYAKWRFRADLGEGLSGKKRPAAFIIRWDESNATVSRILTPDHLYLGQYIFSPFSTNTLFASAYEPQSDGRLLGVKGCFNRPRGIWQVDLDSTQQFPEKWKATLKKLTEGSASARSPRVVGDQLVWLSEAVGGGHVSTSTVDTLNLHTNEGNVVLDVVKKPLDDGFPGLYAPANLPASPVVSLDSKAYVAVQSTYGSRTLVVLVSLDGGYRVLHLDDEFSWNVLATDGNSRLVCSRSTSAIPYEIVLVELKESEPSVKVIDTPTLSDDVVAALDSIKTQVIKIPGRGPTETVVVQSTLNEKVAPCILVPHGGPHATTTTAFSAGTTGMVLEGYTVSLPNYTGSPGFGDVAARALLGQCGRLDVDDCMASLEHIIKLGIAEDGPGKLFVQGGSHGGFLTAHLIGQFPDKFTAASMRNPVISGGDTTGTDIPDWYYLEFGYSYPIQSSSKSTTLASDATSSPTASSTIPPLMTGSRFDELQHASPISYIDAVRTPMLMLIGLSDRRVSPNQGIEYYHALKARAQDKSKVEMLLFEGESHPMDGVECLRVSWEAARDWFARAKVGWEPPSGVVGKAKKG